MFEEYENYYKLISFNGKYYKFTKNIDFVNLLFEKHIISYNIVNNVIYICCETKTCICCSFLLYELKIEIIDNYQLSPTEIIEKLDFDYIVTTKECNDMEIIEIIEMENILNKLKIICNDNLYQRIINYSQIVSFDNNIYNLLDYTEEYNKK